MNFKIFKTKAIKPEILTDEKMEYLFDTSHRNLIYYNYDLNSWNDDTFVYWPKEQEISQLLKNFKTAIDEKSAIYELIAYIQMEIFTYENIHSTKIVHNPYPVLFPPLEENYTTEMNKAVVNKLLMRDKKTGKIVPPSDMWLGAHSRRLTPNEIKSTLKLGTILPHYQSLLMETGAANQNNVLPNYASFRVMQNTVKQK